MNFVVRSRCGGGTRLTSECPFLQIRSIPVPEATHLAKDDFIQPKCFRFASIPPPMEEGEAGWAVGDGKLIVFAIAEKFPRLHFPLKLDQAASTATHRGCGRHDGVALGWPPNVAALLELRTQRS